MRKILWIGGVLAVALCVAIPVAISSDDKKNADATKALMQRKLKESQKALEGLALNDFKKIAASADELIDISKTAEWKVLKDPQYELFSNEFRRRADQMGRSARDKNIDAATLAYVEVTMTCVRCHQHVREVRRTQLEPADAGRALGE